MKVDILLFISSSSDRDLEFMGEYLPDALPKRMKDVGIGEEVHYSIPPSYQGRLTERPTARVRTGEDDVAFWKEIFDRSGASHICRVNGESPFLDASIVSEMLSLHMAQRAEYTFSENIPPGICGDIISKELISAIPDIGEPTLPLHQIIRSNINQFDVELYYREPDLRDKRISFLLTNPRDRRIMENLFRITGGVPAYDSLRNLIADNPAVLFIGPSYLEIELTGACDLRCLYCYRTALSRERGHMDPEVITRLLSQMREFDLPYTVCFGGSGEPLAHPKAYEIISTVRRDPLVERVIVETNGVSAGDDYRSFVCEAGAPVITIVNLSAVDAEGYRAIHGADFFDIVCRNVISLAEAAPNRTHVQIMKIKETEPFLDAYYDMWEKQKIPIILQKQNTYLGRIPDRRYSDLSPLQRIPCWHLQRDLFILSDGRVCFCKQDVDADAAAGNLVDEPLSSIWERKRDAFIRDYRGEFPASPDCALCDEWYTFNF